MKLMHVFPGRDDESHIEELEPDYSEVNGTRTVAHDASSITFALRAEGSFLDFHPAPRRQYVLYLTASVEIGLGDGSSVVMEPGDVLLADDTTGRCHKSSVRKGGVVAFVPLTG